MALQIRRALISVSDKSGIVEFGQALAAAGVELLSTGGTFKALQDAGIAVTEVASYTGFPEMMDGRVKTLHPKVHGGILARRGIDEKIMKANAIDAIDLVVVNLYPFENTVANPNCDLADAIENIDIGGPTMVRAAAKNHNDVTSSDAIHLRFLKLISQIQPRVKLYFHFSPHQHNFFSKAYFMIFGQVQCLHR